MWVAGKLPPPPASANESKQNRPKQHDNISLSDTENLLNVSPYEQRNCKNSGPITTMRLLIFCGNSFFSLKPVIPASDSLFSNSIAKTSTMNDALSAPLFRRIGRIADEKGVRAFVIGGYVRDYFLHRPCTDIDIVVVGSGIEIAEAIGREMHTKVSVFKNFGTAMLHCDGWEVELVGARKESYRADSRKPIVENGTIEDDQLRRDFTINAMAFSLNADTFGQLVDPFNGMHDLEKQSGKCPSWYAKQGGHDSPVK